MCGLTIPVDAEGRVGTIRGDRDDPWSRGFLCPKGSALGKLHEDPDRLRAPLVREGDTFREVSWEEAFARCDELIHGVRDRHGPGAMGLYIGNPVAHNFSLSRYVGALIGVNPRWYSAGTIDTWPRNVVSLLLYGNAWRIPVPDVERTDLFLCMGANPQASNGSLFSCTDILGEIDRIRERGGRTIVVDPRRTGTADKADQWIPIRPGTDAAFLLAVLHVLFDEGLVDLGAVSDLVDGNRRPPGDLPGLESRSGRGADRRPDIDDKEAGPRPGGGPLRRRLRAHRPLQPGVRDARHLAHRHRGHLHREPRPGRRRHVPHSPPDRPEPPLEHP
jgi:anaerobic selenocysteine-containing dehydrogenase